MRLLSLIKECCDKTGNTFEQQLLGGRGFVTIDPRNVEAILSSNFDDYGLGLRIPTFHPLLGSGIFTQDGEAWKSSRNLVRPHLAAYRPENFERIQACTQSLIDSVPDDGLVDLQPLFFKLTFETTMLMLFGDTVLADGWDEEITSQWPAFADAFSLAQDYLATRGRFGQFYWLITDRTFRKACSVTHEFVDRAIAKSMIGHSNHEDLRTDGIRSGDGTDSFVDALLQQTQDPRELRDHCLNILLAGRDTTGCCLSWTL
ncbi:hypothetical protein SLS63_007274 [Diaporthe eres]|uniref:Cytochrome P450 n=1 Tax=Diaporthe eres TaxID=83184 RepID=A0ABR1P5U3_DIAER